MEQNDDSYLNQLRDEYPEMCKRAQLMYPQGWHHLIYSLVAQISEHVSYQRHSRKLALIYNRAWNKANNGDLESLTRYLIQRGRSVARERVLTAMMSPPRIVPEKCDRVRIEQVKEKFGSLRFYYTGGDDHIRSIVSFTETLTAQICEVCGSPGHQRTVNGWVRTVCDKHA